MEAPTDTKLYDAAVKAIEGLKYYYEDLLPGAVAYLAHYFPNAPKSELLSAVESAVCDVFFDGCDIETY